MESERKQMSRETALKMADLLRKMESTGMGREARMCLDFMERNEEKGRPLGDGTFELCELSRRMESMEDDLRRCRELMGELDDLLGF